MEPRPSGRGFVAYGTLLYVDDDDVTVPSQEPTGELIPSLSWVDPEELAAAARIGLGEGDFQDHD